MKLYDVRLDLDLRCNYRCEYCFSRDREISPVFELSSLEKVFKQLARYCWSVYLSCAGEPTLHPQFIEVMKLVKKLMPDVDVSLITNGSLLTDDRIDAILDADISRVYVSIPTLKPDLYKKITSSRVNVEQIMGNVKKLVDKKGSRKFPAITVTMVATPETIPYAPELAQGVMDINADCFKILNLVVPENDDGLQKNVSNDTLIKSVYQEISSVVRLHKKLLEYPYEKNYKKILSALKATAFYKNKLNYLVYTIKKFVDSYSNTKCRMLGNTLRVDTDGRIFLCPPEYVCVANLVNELNVDLPKAINSKLNEIKRNPERFCNECQFYEGH